MNSMRIATVVGARPQFIKAAVVSQAIQIHNRMSKSPQIKEIFIHTGQHYDYLMSRVFFDKMRIPKPDYNLKVGPGTPPTMIGKMLRGIERVLTSDRPDWVLVYGDTNTTLAGALAAAKLLLPVVHVEAGMRSFNRKMPEEINRLLTDHISSVLFCVTHTAVDNLKKEGITDGVFRVGDVMYDAFMEFKNAALQESKALTRLDLKPKSYCLATIHRQENADDIKRLSNIFRAFDELATKDCPFIIPLHPRTQKRINEHKKELTRNRHTRLIHPVHYLDMIALESQARVILTDSGGIQKEAFFVGVPCVTLRDETEWVETVAAGWNILAGAEFDRIVRAFARVNAQRRRGNPWKYYGNGRAGHKVVDRLVSLWPYDLKASGPAKKQSPGKRSLTQRVV